MFRAWLKPGPSHVHLDSLKPGPKGPGFLAFLGPPHRKASRIQAKAWIRADFLCLGGPVRVRTFQTRGWNPGFGRFSSRSSALA